MSRFYDTASPDGPVEVPTYTTVRGDTLTTGQRVLYENSSTSPLPAIDGPLTITELVNLGDMGDADPEQAGKHLVTAILNEGIWEVLADNLRPEPASEEVPEAAT